MNTIRWKKLAELLNRITDWIPCTLENNQQFVSTNRNAPIVERPSFNVEANQNAKNIIFNQAKPLLSVQP